MALPDAVEERRINIHAGGSMVAFFCYNGLDRETNVAKAKALKPYFRRMPDRHTSAIYPILLIGQHPTSSDPDDGGGGTMAARAGGFGGILGAQGVSRTGIPADEITAILDEFLPGHRTRGLSFIPENRWLRDNPAHTVFHEVGHAISYECHTDWRAGGGSFDALRDFPGINEGECGGSGRYPVLKRVAIAYAHLIVSGLSTVGGEANARTIVRSFRDSVGFRRVPDEWWQTAVHSLSYLPDDMRGGR
jgi:hypothetical protein